MKHSATSPYHVTKHKQTININNNIKAINVVRLAILPMSHYRYGNNISITKRGIIGKMLFLEDSIVNLRRELV